MKIYSVSTVPAESDGLAPGDELNVSQHVVLHKEAAWTLT